MDKPLSPSALFAALAMIRLSNWGGRGTVLAFMGTTISERREPWVDLSQRELAKATGVNVGHVGRLLRAMVVEDVLVRDPGAGRRSDGYLPNPDLRGWRKVPWRVDQETAAFRVELINQELNYAPFPPVARASRTRAQDQVARAPWTRALANGCARSLDARAIENQRAPLGPARNGNPARASWMRAQNSTPGEPPPYSLSDEEEEEAKQLIDAIQRATGSPVWGGLVRRIEVIVRSDLALNDALAHVAAAGGKWTPPQLVGQLEARCRGVPAVPVCEPPPAEPAPALYTGWDDPAGWRIDEVDFVPAVRPSALLGQVNGCQNGQREEEG